MAEPTVDVVGWAGNGEQAVELASQRSADIVLLGVDLPDAVEVLERLAGVMPKPPKVILVGDGTPRDELLAEPRTFPGRMDEVAGFVRRTGDMSDMVTLIIALVALANVPSNELNGSKH